MRALAGLLVIAGCGRVGFDVDSTITSSGPCPSFALFCEGFESGLGNWFKVDTVGPSTATIVGSRVHSGTSALEAFKQPSSGPGVAAPVMMMMQPTSTGTLAVRAWISVATPIEHFDLAISLKNAPETDYTAVGGDSVGNWVISESRSDANPIDTASMIATAPVDTWVCLELVFTFGPPHFQVLVNDVEVLSAAAILPSPTLQVLSVGAVRGDQRGFHIFVDDVVVAHQRIGC